MSVRRLSNSTISTQGRGKSSTFIANYSPGVDEMDLIQRVTVGAGGAASITFSNIPQTYQHLQARMIARSTRPVAFGSSIYARFNGDTSTANYYEAHGISGDGTAASAYAFDGGAVGGTNFGIHSGANTAANIFAVNIIDILDYSNSTKNKTVRALYGEDQNGSGFLQIGSGLWISTNAITNISLVAYHGNDFVQYTTAALYGVIA